MKVSIVTVTYNCEDTIVDTLKSVVDQTYANKEIIIIDGNSTDGTLDAIAPFKNNIDILVSEPDKGIYDAMNKAIHKATGEWICFMNAGDSFYDENVLSRVFSKSVSKFCVIYGDTAVEDFENIMIHKAFPLNTMERFLPFCHQSSFVRTDIIKKYMFDINYRICADYNLFYKLWKSKNLFLYVDFPISNYDQKGGGFSAKNINLFYYERALVSSDNKVVAYIKYIILKIKIYIKSLLLRK